MKNFSDPEEVWGHSHRGKIKNHTMNITKVHDSGTPYLHPLGIKENPALRFFPRQILHRAQLLAPESLSGLALLQGRKSTFWHPISQTLPTHLYHFSHHNFPFYRVR